MFNYCFSFDYDIILMVIIMNYFLYGEEQYRLKKTVQSIISEYVTEQDDLHVIRYDAQQTSIDRILEDALTVPFFSPYKVIIVEHANFLSTINDTMVDTQKLIDYFKQPNDTTVLIFIGSFAKLDTRKKITKEIKNYCKIFEFRKLDEQGMLEYLNQEVERRNLQIDADARKEICQRIPLDMETLHHELDKLDLYGDVITKEVVAQLISKPLEEDVFALVDAVVKKNVKKAFSIWKDFCVIHVDAIYIIALLAGQFRFLYEVKSLIMQGRGKAEIVDIVKAHPYRVQLAMQNVSNLSQDDLMHLLWKLAQLDQNIKSGVLDKKLGFEMFLLELQGVN